MHYGCTLLVVSAMVGGVVAYVAWPILPCLLRIPVVQAECVVIGKGVLEVQEHRTHLQMNASGDLMHSLRRQQCHLQQLLAFPIRRTNLIYVPSFSEFIRVLQGTRTLVWRGLVICTGTEQLLQEPTNELHDWAKRLGCLAPVPSFLHCCHPRCLGHWTLCFRHQSLKWKAKHRVYCRFRVLGY